MLQGESGPVPEAKGIMKNRLKVCYWRSEWKTLRFKMGVGTRSSCPHVKAKRAKSGVATANPRLGRGGPGTLGQSNLCRQQCPVSMS